jgi:hypothetical protein
MRRDAATPEDARAIDIALGDVDVFNALTEAVNDDAASPVKMTVGVPPRGGLIDILNWLIANMPAILAFIQEILKLFGL